MNRRDFKNEFKQPDMRQYELTKNELTRRIETLHARVNAAGVDWDAVFIVDKTNQYYFTGTMQDGVFVLKSDGTYGYFARNSYDRAKMESPLENIYPMISYRDVLQKIGDCTKLYIETETMTYAILQRVKKYFNAAEILPVDRIVLGMRAVKSAYELSCMEESGRQHNQLFETVVPALLHEGISEAELTAAMYPIMIDMGYQGVTRFYMFQAEMIIGQVSFGENTIYPTSFDGPGGVKGMYPPVPTVGSRERRLKKGDLVFVDTGHGFMGYHTDRTQLYMYGQSPSPEAERIHNECLAIQKSVVARLKPGEIPSQIYKDIMGGLSKDFLENFMGYGGKRAKFLGHGVGLHVDEFPVIATGFDEPLVENITLAVEPKKGVFGIGLLGSEDTYVVTKDGGRCITGSGERSIFRI